MSDYISSSENILISYVEGARTDVKLTPSEQASLFIKASIFHSAIDFIREEIWLNKKLEQGKSFKTILSHLFQNELSSILFLRRSLLNMGEGALDLIQARTLRLIESTVDVSLMENHGYQKFFLIQSLSEMLGYYIDGEKSNSRGLRLHRTFDNIDQLLDLSCSLDKNLETQGDDLKRLHLGSRNNVQLGYSSIMLAFHALELRSGTTFVDLRAGNGKVCIVGALLHSDIFIKGYDYVQDRVDSANDKGRSLALDNLRFISQDLSLKSFKLPIADVYFLYCSFWKSEYEHIINQIHKISLKQKIAIVIKGNACVMLTRVAVNSNWPDPIYIDRGNLCIFKSK